MTVAVRGNGGDAARRADQQATSETDQAPRSAVTLTIMATLALLGVVALLSLCIWQIERRSWKLDLIQRVAERSQAAPANAPGPADWPGINRNSDEYRRLRASGHFRAGADVLVQAVTDLGPGFWVLTPLQTDAGFTVLVNRGFVPPEHRGESPAPTGEVTVTGLLRITEPKGGFLRHNDPAAQRWYSRDVAAIAEAQKLQEVAPYFIDADAATGAQAWPRGGLTVISFPNNHLVYAVTWFVLAAMLAGGAWFVARDEWRIRQKRPSGV